MDRMVIEGGRALRGRVEVLGAKNAVLKEMVATLLAPGRHFLRNVPGILDVALMGDVLEHIGVMVRRTDHAIEIEVPDELRPEAPLDLVRLMRASIVVLGPLLARCGRAAVAFPGGDDLGARPIDMHLDGLEQMGVVFELEHGVLTARVDGRLRGAEVTLDFPSVGATENLLFAATLADGATVIHNAAREPEIQDLIRQLSKMGAVVEGASSSTLVVEGSPALHPTDHSVVPDRLEAGTYAVAAAITAGDIEIASCVPDHLRMEMSKLEQVGCVVHRGDDWLRITGPERPVAVDFATLPFPGFHTDMHPQMVALLSVAEGTSVITENLYDARFRYVGELARMGADITIDWQHAVVRGVPSLSGCPVVAPDIRAGAALALAGLRAEGETVVSAIHHIDRGYEGFVERLSGLGASITRAPDEK
ncbi:MAG TPA: UDP-N-acetylglucosamine 1-carboxyvinyltransferase [Acidimicrobiia bacterium]|nr:UDP-N-acetylglucosamine 1-carboxyvinyltransferase [Acidimicrobiia bacterium]